MLVGSIPRIDGACSLYMAANISIVYVCMIIAIVNFYSRKYCISKLKQYTNTVLVN